MRYACFLALALILSACAGVKTDEQVALTSTAPSILRVTPDVPSVLPGAVARVAATTRNVSGPGYRIIWHTTLGAIQPQADGTSALFTSSQKGTALITAELQLDGVTVSSGANTIKIQTAAEAKPKNKFLFF